MVTASSGALGQAPGSWRVLGSFDQATWVSLDSRSGITWTNGTLTQSFTVTTAVAYQYYRMIITAPFVSGVAYPSTITIGELRLFMRDALPFSNTCGDVPPVSRIIGNPANATLAGEMVAVGSANSNYYTQMGAYAANVSAAGNGISFTGAPSGSFARTMPAVYSGGTTVALWFKAANLTSTWNAVAMLGLNLYLYVSSAGLCVVGNATYSLSVNNQGSLLGSSTGCYGLAGANGSVVSSTPYNTDQQSSQWHHVAFSASSSLGMNMWVDGSLAASNGLGTWPGAEYPPTPLYFNYSGTNATTNNNVNVTGQLYGNGIYVPGELGKGNDTYAFDKNSSTIWNGTALYTGNSGVLNTTGTWAGISAASGDGLSLTLPAATQISGYQLQSSPGIGPMAWTLFCSSGNGNWAVIDTQTNVSWTTGSQNISIRVTSFGSYQSSICSQYRIIFVQQAPGSNGIIGIAEWRLYGIVPFSTYYPASVTLPLGFHLPTALGSNVSLLAGDFQAYAADYSANNGGASLYYGGNCTVAGGTTIFGSAVSPPYLDVLHRFSLATVGVNTSAIGTSDLVDTGFSNSLMKAVYTNFAWSGRGVGVSLGSGYAQLADSNSNSLDLGYLGTLGVYSASTYLPQGFTLSFWVMRTNASQVGDVPGDVPSPMTPGATFN